MSKLSEEIERILLEYEEDAKRGYYHTYGTLSQIRDVFTQAIERENKFLEWKMKEDVGTVYYTNPDGKKYRAYNADHVDKAISDYKQRLLEEVK